MQDVFKRIIERLEDQKKGNPFIYGEKDRSRDASVSRQTLDYAIEIVKQEAEKYNDGWIPCSERMQEDEQVVLTCKCKSISILRYSTKTNHWYELSGNWWWSANMVTAWQPLPQPYQPKGE